MTKTSGALVEQPQPHAEGSIPLVATADGRLDDDCEFAVTLFGEAEIFCSDIGSVFPIEFDCPISDWCAGAPAGAKFVEIGDSLDSIDSEFVNGSSEAGTMLSITW